MMRTDHVGTWLALRRISQPLREALREREHAHRPPGELAHLRDRIARYARREEFHALAFEASQREGVIVPIELAAAQALRHGDLNR